MACSATSYNRTIEPGGGGGGGQQGMHTLHECHSLSSTPAPEVHPTPTPTLCIHCPAVIQFVSKRRPGTQRPRGDCTNQHVRIQWGNDQDVGPVPERVFQPTNQPTKQHGQHCQRVYAHQRAKQVVLHAVVEAVRLISYMQQSSWSLTQSTPMSIPAWRRPSQSTPPHTVH